MIEQFIAATKYVQRSNSVGCLILDFTNVIICQRYPNNNIVGLEMCYIIAINNTDDDDYAERQHIENNEITAKSRCAYCKRRVTLKERVAGHIVNIKTKEMFLVDMHDECKTTGKNKFEVDGRSYKRTKLRILTGNDFRQYVI